MKAIRNSLFPIAFSAALAIPAAAIQAPADNAPAPAEAAEAPPAAVAETAFLGIGADPLPELLATHLNLKPGEGVVVRSVHPDGPAAKAGVQENDIIVRIGGQAVASQQDLAAQIRKHKPGEEISIDTIRKGKAEAKTATLAARPEGMAAQEGAPADRFGQLRLEGLPNDLADRVRKMIEQNLPNLGEEGLGGLIPDNPEAMEGIHDAFEQLQKQFRQGQQGERGFKFELGRDGFNMKHSSSFKMQDAEGSVEMQSTDKGKEATVRDKEGEVIWSGPWETDQDKAAAPPDVRERLNSLNLDETFNGQGLRLRLGQGLNLPFGNNNNDDDDDDEKDADGDQAAPAPEAPEAGPME